MGDPHTVTVISTVFNEQSNIRVLLNALLAQTLRPNEIIVVDGGSTDGTIDILRDYAERERRIRFRVEPGVNIAKGRNIAIENAKSTIIAVTDAGCRPRKDWLAELVRPLLDNPHYGAVSGKRQVDALTKFERFAGLLSTSSDSVSEEDRVFHGRNCAFRTTVWREVGGYPEWLYTAEDTLFCQCAKMLGCRVAFAAEAIVFWRPRQTLAKLAKQYFLYGVGTGRINQVAYQAAFYHVRNHTLLMATALLGFLSPWFWLLSFAVLIFIYHSLISPVVRRVRSQCSDRAVLLYVPIIVFTRSLFSNLGQLVGLWQYHNVAPFRQSLNEYISLRKKHSRG